eukprot:Gb_37098 [translate_table: standard]
MASRSDIAINPNAPQACSVTLSEFPSTIRRFNVLSISENIQRKAKPTCLNTLLPDIITVPYASAYKNTIPNRTHKAKYIMEVKEKFGGLSPNVNECNIDHETAHFVLLIYLIMVSKVISSILMIRREDVDSPTLFEQQAGHRFNSRSTGFGFYISITGHMKGARQTWIITNTTAIHYRQNHLRQRMELCLVPVCPCVMYCTGRCNCLRFKRKSDKSISTKVMNFSTWKRQCIRMNGCQNWPKTESTCWSCSDVASVNQWPINKICVGLSHKQKVDPSANGRLNRLVGTGLDQRNDNLSDED